MRLFRLELKRILKSRRTLILLAIALLLSVAMAYLPISFEGINRPNEDGTVTELDGLAAIKYKQDLYKTSAGEVTPDRIKSALETYQSCVREYGPVEEEGFPLAVYIENRRLRNATSRINTAFFVTYKQITPHRIWYNRVD